MKQTNKPKPICEDCGSSGVITPATHKAWVEIKKKHNLVGWQPLKETNKEEILDKWLDKHWDKFSDNILLLICLSYLITPFILIAILILLIKI